MPDPQHRTVDVPQRPHRTNALVTPELTFGVAMSTGDVSLVRDLSRSALPAVANWDVRAEAFVATGVAPSGPNDIDIPPSSGQNTV